MVLYCMIHMKQDDAGEVESFCSQEEIQEETSKGNGCAEESPVGGTSLLNVSKAAGQGEMERKILK